eukprot:2145852-Pleurochrysis_carterae.AAC.1
MMTDATPLRSSFRGESTGDSHRPTAEIDSLHCADEVSQSYDRQLPRKHLIIIMQMRYYRHEIHIKCQ